MEKIEHNKYTMELKTQGGEDLFYITLNGFFKVDEANQFMEDYEEVTGYNVEKEKQQNNGWISPNNYKLVVDCQALSTFSKDVLPILKKAFEVYMNTGFEDIIMINPTSVISKKQLHKYSEEWDFTGKYVDSLKDVI